MGLERRADAFEHQVESRQLAHFMVADVNGDLLENTEHGALADGAVLALEGVMGGQVLDGRLKQRKLVGDEGIAVNEVVAVLKILVGHRAIGEVEQGFEVVGLGVIKVIELADACIVFQ